MGVSVCFKTNIAIVVMTVMFHLVCYLGADWPTDERQRGACGRRLRKPVRESRNQQAETEEMRERRREERRDRRRQGAERRMEEREESGHQTAQSRAEEGLSRRRGFREAD